jgi:type VI secretion system secreted protein Hcp
VEDYFLKIDGIAGESRDAKHKDEIELVSFSWGLTQAGGGVVGGGAGAGRAKFHDFQFVMHVSKASPQLMLASASGKHIKEAQLSVRRAGKEQLEYLKIKFTDVLISSFEEAAAGGEPPQETLAFNYSKIELDYRPQQPAGQPGAAIKAGWDLQHNVKL